MITLSMLIIENNFVANLALRREKKESKMTIHFHKNERKTDGKKSTKKKNDRII